MRYLILSANEYIVWFPIPNQDYLNGWYAAVAEFDPSIDEMFLWPEQSLEIYTWIERLPVDEYHTEILKELKQLGIIE